MITTETPSADDRDDSSLCTCCAGSKKAPIAAVAHLGEKLTIYVCELCGRDLANAIGFMCIKDGSWSKLEPRRKGK